MFSPLEVVSKSLCKTPKEYYDLLLGAITDSLVLVHIYEVGERNQTAFLTLEIRVAELCENVKTYHSDTGFIGGFVVLNSGQVSNEGSTIGKAIESPLKNREALIITFWQSFEDHERSHRSETFQPLFKKVLELCENGNEEIAYKMLWQGKAYTTEEAKAAKEAKGRYATT